MIKEERTKVANATFKLPPPPQRFEGALKTL
jgi:hypothetical protein